MKELYFIYELEQIDSVALALRNNPDIGVCALDREIEYELERRGVSYISAKEYRDPQPYERIIFAESYVKNFFTSSDWSFFVHRDISLGTVFTFALQEYLGFFLYYASLFKRIAEAYPGVEWRLQTPFWPPPRSGGPLAKHMYTVVTEAAQVVGASHTIKVHIESNSALAQNALSAKFFSFKRNVFGAGVSLLNWYVYLRATPKPMHLVVSDYWRNIEPFAQALPEASITLLDRSELRNISLRQIFKHTMQFKHLQVSRDQKKISGVAAKKLYGTWLQLRRTSAISNYDDVDVTSAIYNAIDTLFSESVLDVLLQIDGSYTLLNTKPTAVLLRASVSGQTHFGVLALVAKKLGVPAIELQHGLEYLGPGSLSNEHAAQFMALYGPAIQKELLAIGYEPSRLINVGSPRFDIYSKVTPDPLGSVVCIGPDVYVGGSADTYDSEDYFSKFFSSLDTDSKSVVKLRGGSRESFFRTMIVRVKGAHAPVIESTRPLLGIFKEARVVVSCYSTAILESLQCGVPTLLLPASKLDQVVAKFHFTPYVEADVFSIAKDSNELKSQLDYLKDSGAYDLRSQKIREFMAKEFCFDGHASERLAQYCRSL